MRSKWHWIKTVIFVSGILLPAVGSFAPLLPKDFRSSLSKYDYPTPMLFQRSITTSNHEEEENSADPVASLDALNALVGRSKITALVQAKSNFHGTLQLSFHLTVLVAAACLYPLSPFASTLGMAFVSSFFFHGLHETVHRTAFRSKRTNHICLGFLP